MTRGEQELARIRSEFAGIAAASASVQERAEAILDRLGRILDFDAGWLAVRDPEQRRHVPLATTGMVAPLRDYFRRPEADAELDRLGLNGDRLPLLASEIPGSLSEVLAWGDHLLPAGFREGVAAPVVTTTGRHIGFFSLISADPSRPDDADRRVVAVVTAAVADDLDRSRDVAETARIVAGADAGVVVSRAGHVQPLPGLPDDRLLAPGSPVLAVATGELAGSGEYASFLAPTAGPGGPRLVRVTALDVARPDLDHLSVAVLLSPPGDLHGLTPLDLRILGLLVEGAGSVRELAVALPATRRTVADSLAWSLAVLHAGNLTDAAVRALRGGLRIPSAVAGPDPA